MASGRAKRPGHVDELTGEIQSIMADGDGRSKRRLLLATDIWVDASRPRLPARYFQRFRGLEQHFDVSWTFIATDANAGDHAVPDHIRLVFVPPVRSKWHLLALFPRYVKILADAMGEADVVLVLAPMFTTLPALLAARLRGRPTILLMLAPMSAIDFFNRSVIRRMVPTILNLEVLLSTETLVLNSHLAKGVLPPLRRRMEVFMPSNIGEGDFLPIVEPSPYAPVELLFVGRLIQLKRVDIAIKAVSLLRGDGIDATLTVVGDGADLPRLVRVREEVGLSDVVSFVGWTDDPAQLREHYRRAFALLLPSEIEAFGMVVLEAMAAGTPVVRTAPIGGIDLLEPDVDVLIAGVNSAEAFANAVKRLQVDRGLYLQIARAAQKKASTLTREAWQGSFRERAEGLIRDRQS
jgi:glycosyltransferase involved in cell wall biosynthesis